MAEFLATIAAHVRDVVDQRRREMPLSALRDRALFHAPTRGFISHLGGSSRRIIAEIKRASPSKGVLRAAFDPIAIAQEYERHGASAISVLTEERFFQGCLAHLEQIKRSVTAPLLRKDFVLEPYQLVEAKSYGADAVLLIAALLDPGKLQDLRVEANELSLDSLVEIHNEQELNNAIKAGAQLVGINNRDLRTFEVSLATTERLAPLLPPGILAVCESGIDGLKEIQQVERWGVRLFLVGEALMRAPHPGVKLRGLLA